MLSQAGGVALLAVLNRAHAHDSRVDGARHAVRQLYVDLRHLELSLVIRVVFLDVTLGGGIDHVALLEALDGLVLGDDAAAVGAADGVGVALVLLVSSVVSSL